MRYTQINYRSTDSSATIAVNHSGKPGTYTFVMTTAKKLRKDLEIQAEDLLSYEQGLRRWADENCVTEADIDAMFSYYGA